MKITILSERGYQSWPSWDVVYEWEDEFCKLDCFQLKCDGSRSFASRLKRKIIGKATKHLPIKKKYEWDGADIKIQWIMNVTAYRRYRMKNVIPFFLDFPVAMIPEVVQATADLPAWFVTCKDVYNRAVELGSKNCYYIPISISDKYCDYAEVEKDIDVIQFGRKNLTLHGFMQRYCEEHPEVEYVYQTENGSLTYESTRRGSLGKFDTRDEYLRMMQRCRVSLVSTPAMDQSRDFGGIDFFTPRFYESPAMGCRMVGRYTENEEAKLLNIGDVCANVETYEQFADVLDGCLHDRCDQENTKRWLSRHWTSKRVDYILKVMEEKTGESFA